MNSEYSEDFKAKYIKYFILSLVIAFIVTGVIAVLLDDSGDYRLITRDTEVSGWISNLDRERGALYFNIQDTLKYRVSGHMYNYEYSQDDFFLFKWGRLVGEKTGNRYTLYYEAGNF
jgi:hypothetical protein